MPVIFDDTSFVDGGVIGCWVQSTEYLVLVSDDGTDDLYDV